MKNGRRRVRKGRLVVLALVIFAIIGAGVFCYVKPMIEEYYRVGFVVDKEDSSKVMYRNEQHEYVYGLQTIDGKQYYFDEKTGYMSKGLKEINGSKYMFNDEGVMVTNQFEHIKDKDSEHVSYFDHEGKMVKGLQTIQDKQYFFNEDGSLVTNQYKRLKIDETEQISYFDEEGKMVTGRKDIDGQDRFFDDNGKLSIDTEYLQTGIQNILNSYRGDISIYFKDLTSNESFVMNDHTYYPCCMIKVPSLITIYNCIRDGIITKTPQIEHWIDLMIRISDNTAFNNLMCAIGGGNGVKGVNMVTQTAHEIGMHDTDAKHGLKPGENYFSAGGANKSCAKDLGLAFEKIYRHEVATPELCDEMIEILKTCDDYEELQNGLPSDVAFAHKTGCAYALYHDGGIVYLDGREYILVCFSDNARYTVMMPEVSKFVYEYQANFMPSEIF